MKQPLIGITADSEQPGGYSKFPWYALRQNYCSAVSAAGGVPIVLPHEPNLVDHYLDMIDGLVVSGGAFDVDPALFGATSRHATVSLKEGRTDFELRMTQGALKADMPMLGICGGQQLLAVALGGTLIQHIPDEVKNPLAHEQPNPRDQPGHGVILGAGTYRVSRSPQRGALTSVRLATWSTTARNRPASSVAASWSARRSGSRSRPPLAASFSTRPESSARCWESWRVRSSERIT